MDATARIANVIEVRTNDSLNYFTLEGVFIGGLNRGGKPFEEETPNETKGSVVKSPTPHEVKRQQHKQIQNMQTEDRLKHLKDDVV